MLLELEAAAEEGDVVIGGIEGDQAEGEASDGLGDPKLVKTEAAGASPGERKIC